MEALIKLGVFLLLVLVGFWRGRRNERAHLATLDAEEEALRDVLVFASRYPPRMDLPQDPILVSGSAVVGSDHFRLLLASLRKVVGGNYRAYENLLERGRRQALVRLKAAARAQGARMVFNLRYATSRISNPKMGETTQVEVIAYGTAFVPAAGRVADSRVGHVCRAEWADDKVFNVLENHYSRYWLIGWFALVVYVFAETLTANSAPPSWRYTDGAPWAVFWVLAVLGGAGLLVAARRTRPQPVAWGWGIVLTLLSTALLPLALYFAALRLNAITAPGGPPAEYIVQTGGALLPRDPAHPALYFEEEALYWSSRPAGEEVRVPLACGWLGFCQYDLMAFREDYRRFYAAQED